MMQTLGFVAALLQAFGIWGALPPWVVQSERYRACRAQATAPDVVRVLVTGVKRQFTWCGNRGRRGKRWWRYQTLQVEAKVLSVSKTASHLRMGSRIRFGYSLFRLCPRMTGPANRPQPASVSKGDRVWVFLRKGKAGKYLLAAGAMSIVSKLPHIRSVAQWTKKCDRRYPGRHR